MNGALLIIAIFGSVIGYLWGTADGMAREHRRARRIAQLEGAAERDAPRDPDAPSAVIHLADFRDARDYLQP